MHAINIISGISMIGVLIGTAALIILLSVFNGLEKTILAMYSNFSPEIRIQAKVGKTFNPDTPYLKLLQKDKTILSYAEVLQDKVVVKYGERTFIATMMGVSGGFLNNPGLDSTIMDGSFSLHAGDIPAAVIGITVKYMLSIDIRNAAAPLQIFGPKRGNVISINPADEFIPGYITPVGVFQVQPEFDGMVITPIEFARQIFDEPNRVSYINLNYTKGTNLNKVQADIQEKLGHQYVVKSRSQQNTALYKTLNFEKWAIFMILAFVIVIAAFNIIGSLTMLVIEKRKDIAILTSLGANKQLIQGIFFVEGMMISLIGCAVGILLGYAVCILQQYYGLVKVNANIAVANNAYPIDIRSGDFVLVFVTVLAISLLASAISARLSIKGLDDIKQDL
ncbi:FtsX-like permease family protein [Mucilaginibacter antarcticus]|uniref:FtsX-like permease family protein n=3 Tax=Mucilaginibacter antarcticus TaxID=1855725 RepID=A0ABW5XJY5_9SPHI